MKERAVCLITLMMVIIFLPTYMLAQSDSSTEMPQDSFAKSDTLEFRDFGNNPFVFNIEDYTKQNENYRITLWTGEFMQLTIMSIKPGEDIGLEVHMDHDQFIRVEEGQGIVKMGDSEDDLPYTRKIEDDFAIMIPAGKWHNLFNHSDKPLKLYSIYAPKEHKPNTIHNTREDALADENDH